ncbi:MAG TPA: esterase [bacterium]|nr:esterase [bacterium]
MKKPRGNSIFWMGCLISILFSPKSKALAQDSRRELTPNDTLQSVRILEVGNVCFRIFAPEAGVVSLGGTDMPAVGWSAGMTKRPDGVWETTVGPVDPGSYRYHFNVDGVFVIDPRNPSTSESNSNTWSLFHVGGADFMDTRDVPRGAVSELTYYSGSLQRFRRMHVYTPPGYESGGGKFPVFYLLHGAMDSDDSWTTVGRAGFILDNLIAEGKAVPMVVVMPAGHTGPFRFGAPRTDGRDPFLDDLNENIRPLIESRYRVRPERKHRAIAGLSMGGGHTLAIAIPGLADYAYIGVFSSGVFGIAGGTGAFGLDGATWEERHREVLDDPDLKMGLRLVWFATGKDDFLLETTRKTVEVLRNHDFEVVYEETEGGHTWINWRNYLYAFVPLLFR